MAINDEDFAKKLERTVTDSYTGFCILLGVDLDLFQHITSRPRTIEEIAQASNCKARYIKEWLCALATSGFVKTEDGNSFFMPEEQRQHFSKSSPAMQNVSWLYITMAAVYPKIVECFKVNGPWGTLLSDYPEKHEELPGIVTEETFVKHMFVHDPEILERLEKPGCRYLDVGCGAGGSTRVVAKLFPNAACFGLDISKRAIDRAVNGVVGAKFDDYAPNLHYCLTDAANMPAEWTATFDYVTSFDTIHDQAKPAKVLAEIYRILKPGAIYSLIDMDAHSDLLANMERPHSSVSYAVSLFDCMPLSLGPTGDGAGLGSMWGREKAIAMLRDAGFVDLKFHPMNDLINNYHCSCRKPV